MIANISLDTFFSTIEIVNGENIPMEGPVILYGNHQNQFVDAMIMLRAAERPVSFIVAEVSMHKPVIGTLARAAEAVPVVRPQDLAKVGPGRFENIDLENCTITGVDTKFTEIPAGNMVGIKKVGNFVVVKAESDTKLTFRPIPLDVEQPNLAAFDPKDNTYKITPKVQQSEMFNKVFDSLREGKCIGIFPEGGSHDRTELLPLKAGVSMMALGALSQDIPVTLVPIGTNYFSGHVFRSKVFVDVGKPIQVPKNLIEMYKDKSTRREACNKLLSDMQVALDCACLTAPDFETLKTIRTARRMYQNKAKLTPKEYIDLNLRFNQAAKVWKDDPRFGVLMKDIHEYLEFGRAQGLTDKEVRDLPPLGSIRTVLNAVKDVLTTLVMSCFILPLISFGVLLNVPIALYSKKVIPREMKKALAGSSVKVAARDVAASQQIMIAIKMIPSLHILYSCLWIIFFVITWPYYQREPGSLGNMFVYNAFWVLPLCFLFFGPYYSFTFCPKMLEILFRRWRLWPRHWLCIRSLFSKRKRDQPEFLRLERKKLTIRVQDLVEQLIQSLPEWENDRIINRAKLLKQRSKSIREIAKGDLSSRVPSIDNLASAAEPNSS
mmetsp:Transcript_14791/g.24063  ORF Transcript_14791/g.24063 Transcript_14791/m.24063 type:complete len:606 (-) Transcript_14791:141-1958(-)